MFKYTGQLNGEYTLLSLSFRLTYEIITEESLEIGDKHDHGFCDTYGTPITSEIKKGFPNCRDVPNSEIELLDPNKPDIEAVLEAAIDLGCYLEMGQNDSSAYSDGTQDIQTGDETSYCLHFQTYDWYLKDCIQICLVAGRILPSASEYFEKIQNQPKQGELL
jgi:hypothetical protein